MGVALKNELQQKLAGAGQSHLLAFWDELPVTAQQQLAEQILAVDLDQIRRLYEDRDGGEDWESLAARAVTPPAIRLTGENAYSVEDARHAGEAALREGRVAVVLVAGGQGSRLGFQHPKGMFPIGPISKRTLFEMHADRLLAASKRYGVEIPLYLMTSPATHEETVEYFRAHDQSGLKELSIFCQGTMPAVDSKTGKILLEAKGRLFRSPDGHGGTLAALVGSGSLAEMKSRGIERLFYFQVDNPLVAIAGPELMGYHILSGSEMTCQVVAKHDPHEKVGIVAEIDGELRIIEYSDLPLADAQRRDADGQLSLWAGSIAVHVFDAAFLDRVKDSTEALPFHRALKKVAFVNEGGDVVEPVEPNAIKFERFIFDLLPLAKRGLVVEVAEKDGFAPLKNAPGAPKDTAASVQAAIVAQHRDWLEAAGATVADGARVEINPRFAIDAAELKSKIDAGTTIKKDTYFSA